MLSSILLRTLRTLMMSRTILTTMGCGRSARMIVSVMGDLGAPRISLTASLSDMPLVGVSSILMIRSPAWMPARAAGVSSMGEMTFTKPSSAPTSMPSPPNSPCVAVCISRKASASR
ncbi:Uncharacterised protein [Bordetella pertussis]|nr:Uncharacterised protein [Bordetella pertussis]